MALPLRKFEMEPEERPRPVRPVRRNGRRFAGVTGTQWAVLGISIAFLAGVRIYATQRESLDLRAFRGGSDVASLWTQSPRGAIRAEDLALSWEQDPAAASYRLGILTVTGSVVVDGIETVDTFWAPPPEALPALPSGEYRWTVEALDPAGQVVARSGEATFNIGG